MDLPGASPEELESVLNFLDAANAWLGGWAVLRERFEAWSARWDPGRVVTVLDVGTGGGDLPLHLLRWGRRRGFRLRVTGIDSDPTVLSLARRRTAGAEGLELLRSSLEEYAARGRRHDYVMGSLFLHHVPPSGLTRALRLCDGLAETGLLFNDLRRSAAAYWAARLATCLSGRLPRHDGPLSVLRAFTPRELEEAAAQAGLGYLRVRPGPFFRLSLAGERP